MSAGRSSATLILNILIFLSGCLDFKYVTSTEPTAPWYENLPAVAMDYKVHIDPGKEDCYFQYVNPGATLYVSFQVVRGGDGMAGFAVRNPKGEIVHPYQWKPSSEYQDQQSMGGYYSVCIDNQFSRFAAKLVNIYLTVVRYDMWEQYTKEVEELNMNMENFTSTVQTVERNINHMLQYQYHTRGREAWDMSLLSANNSYVVRWSLIQITVIAITTVVQVYFVRKLFDTKSGSGGFSKTRI
ncbi:transmembrane emp24 domain-containing protein B [Anthonomus grandis grandis]|uniref:transmembrane emp24 domain-containing protein B n=1 Tax=Anthonomus grandis grandis TaxID=2921223 RepID=UPI0021657E2E|nr:transmembrane emp24 domain-containing protein B [Anthonomus grandis grandis]